MSDAHVRLNWERKLTDAQYRRLWSDHKDGYEWNLLAERVGMHPSHLKVAVQRWRKKQQAVKDTNDSP
jgi:hypothetical protein